MDLIKSFSSPMDGMQKLSLALLVLILVVFALSILQLRTISQSIDDAPLKLEQSSAATAKIKREMGRLNKLEDNLKRSSERHSELLKGVDVRMRSSDADSVNSWRSKTGILRAQLKQDLERLHQFNAETSPQLNKLALSLESLLLQEEMQWISLQEFLEKQADKAVNSDERGQFYQSYMNEFLDTIRALSGYRSVINEFKDKLQTLANDGFVKRRNIETNLENHHNSFQYYLIVAIVCFVLGVIASCGAYGLRIRRERRSRERRRNSRNVENDRRQNTRSVEIDRRQNTESVENDHRQNTGSVENDRRQKARRVENDRRENTRSVKNDRRKSDRS